MNGWVSIVVTALISMLCTGSAAWLVTARKMATQDDLKNYVTAQSFQEHLERPHIDAAEKEDYRELTKKIESVESSLKSELRLMSYRLDNLIFGKMLGLNPHLLDQDSRPNDLLEMPTP